MNLAPPPMVPAAGWPVALLPDCAFSVSGDTDEHRTDVIGLTLRGELDVAAADRLQVAARLLLDLSHRRTPGRLAYLELTGLTFLDTWGLDSLAQATDLLRGGGRRVLVVGANGQVRRLLQFAAREGWLSGDVNPADLSTLAAVVAATKPIRPSGGCARPVPSPR